MKHLQSLRRLAAASLVALAISPAAQAYAQINFAEAAQEIFAANGLRPVDPRVLARHPDFAAVKLFSVEGWSATFARHFAGGGTFDRIYTQQ